MPKTYSDLYISARNALRAQGVESADVEARLLVATAAGKTTAQLLRDMRYYTTTKLENHVDELLKRRLAGEPVAYITGMWEFYGLPMEVDRSVLIPRVDTEVLAKAVIDSLEGSKLDARVLDLCCGSGCIGCAVAKTLPRSRVVMADVSPDAIELSRRNVKLNGLEGRVSFMLSDVTKAPPMMTGSFDVIVSNPPYIPTMEVLTLDASVRDYEPVWALDGGEDGLDFYRAILRGWMGTVRPGGMVMFEVGEGQAQSVRDLMRMAGLRETATIQDTRGVDRVVTAKA